MDAEKIKHLEFIQNIITRLNTNSFQIKSMTITIVAALLAVYVSTNNSYFIMLPLLPTMLFWFLDAYYLQQERKFRGLYNDVAGATPNSTPIKSFEMRPELYKGNNFAFLRAFLSKTVLPIYLFIIISLIVVYFYLRGQCHG